MEETDVKQLKTGTTTVGVVCKNAVVLGAERKATMGYLVASKDTQKIVQVEDHIGMTVAGSVGDAQALQRYIQAELRLYNFNEGRRIPVSAAAHLIANMLYSRRFYPYMVQLIIGGHDEKGPHVFSFDPTGSIQDEKEYFSTGSGSVMALGVLEDKYRPDMPVEEAKKLVIRAIRSATKRDIASGGSGIDIIVIDSGGYHKVPEDEVKKIAE
jgi:proteasome beta subunit